MTEEELDGHLIKRGFYCVQSNGGKHWQYRSDAVVLNTWPTTADEQGKTKWMVFGKVFMATCEQILGLYDAGRLMMPGDANESTCRACGAPVWWIRNHNEKNVPLDANGEAHYVSCAQASLFRR